MVSSEGTFSATQTEIHEESDNENERVPAGIPADMQDDTTVHDR